MLIPYADPVSGLCAAVGAVAYLYSSLTTGRSAHLDVSELECMALALLEPLLEAGSGSDPARYPYTVSSDGPSPRVHPFGSPPGHPGVPVRTMGEVLRDGRLSDAWMVDRTTEIAATGTVVARAPWTWDGQPAGTPSGAPTLFADTRSVLREVARIDDAEIDRLVAAGAIATADQP
jgi:crotonobetainyl-CoA:carnitine CoA-transferase CaiB-like acyl-CoA transferase